MERLLVADQTLWRRVPTATSAVLWPVEVLLFGWGIGWWTGLATVVALGVASVALPSRLKVSLYLVDLLERLFRLPLSLGWLLLVWHLGVREPLFPVLGQPLLGSVAVTACLWLLTRLLTLLTRLATRRALARSGDNA